ncbi:NADP-dependent oxidoreductase [Homoserinimonas hongtaonis]|uniref:NADP-dependent oxidoreductase n=1 Tax=Homoserinimonas hongtaonis TaxID=2079791 RepID=UPI001F5449DE|nr:NADP-dependent oxidoreductase [Salinibacterium hongtaonis]
MTDTSSPTMRAVVIDELGGTDRLRLTQLARPVPVSAELLVQLHAAALNPIDAKTRAGKGAAAGIRSFPLTLGNDFSGVVAQAAYEAHPLRPGAEVYGMLSVPRTNGSYAEFAAVPDMSIARKPSNLSHVEAAAVPLAALTADGALRVAGVTAGSRVLIHAGAGGVGHFAVQFAALAGAEVITTASPRNADWLRELGASEVIDYGSTRFEDVVSGVDIVIDLIGNVHDNTGSRSLGVLRADGILVNVPTGSWPSLAEDAAAAGRRATGFKVSPDGRRLAEFTDLIEAGKLRVHIDAVFPLDRVAEAHALLEQGHTRGKISLDLTR